MCNKVTTRSFCSGPLALWDYSLKTGKSWGSEALSFAEKKVIINVMAPNNSPKQYCKSGAHSGVTRSDSRFFLKAKSKVFAMASSFRRLRKEIHSGSLNGLGSLFSGFLMAADVLSLTPFILHAAKESLPLSVAWIRPHAHLGNSEYIGLSQPGSTSAARCDIHFMANQNNNPKNKYTHTKSNQQMASKEEMNSPRSLSRAPTSHEKLVIFIM